MAGVQEEKLAGVIERFYEAATQPEHWRDVLHEASLAFGAEGIAFVPFGVPSLTATCSQGVDELVGRFVGEGWHLTNPRAGRGAAMNPQGFITESMIFTQREMDFLPFNAELVNRLGFRWFAGAKVAEIDKGLVTISVERKSNQQQFTSGELEKIGSTLPHLRQAVHLMHQLGLARAGGMLDAFDCMQCGGILLDWLGRVVRTNRSADRLLGRALKIRHGHLKASEKRADDQLQRVIGNVLATGHASDPSTVEVAVVPREQGRPFIVSANPLTGSGRDLFGRAKAIIMIIDSDEHHEPGEPILRQAFSLTPAESRVALGLARGLELQEIATAAGVTPGTARAQLKAIFAKTDTHRQSELVALLGRLARIGAGSPS
jgi:DNA-binding CsgD family transcriptional regulator